MCFWVDEKKNLLFQYNYTEMKTIILSIWFIYGYHNLSPSYRILSQMLKASLWDVHSFNTGSERLGWNIFKAKILLTLPA